MAQEKRHCPIAAPPRHGVLPSELKCRLTLYPQPGNSQTLLPGRPPRAARSTMRIAEACHSPPPELATPSRLRAAAIAR
jgi:hypothetical protein